MEQNNKHLLVIHHYQLPVSTLFDVSTFTNKINLNFRETTNRPPATFGNGFSLLIYTPPINILVAAD
jgi:hypothetical protein